MEEQASRRLASAFDSPTFGEDGSFQVDKPVGSMSISPCGRDVVLASRQGLHVIDLDSPWAPPRHLPHHTPWEVADVQWSPFAARDYWVVSTSNQKALVWNLAMSNSQASIEHVLHAHTRAITDINFSAHHPDILATCAVDSFVHCWDLRHPSRPAFTFCDWFAGATQVKWNRQDSHIIASSHDKFLRIWDDRKGAYPLRSIEAHDTKIYGVDWNRTRSNGIVTCSLDKTIKFWDCSNEADVPERIIRTPFPVWRARHTPFGWGVLAMPQRGDNDLHLYDRRLSSNAQNDEVVSPVRRFEGHQDQVKEFLWRPRGTIEDGIDNREFQLVSWGADRILRLHHVDEKALADVGYEKGKEVHRKLNLTRKNAPYKTFREEPAKLGSNTRKGVVYPSPSPHGTPIPTGGRSALSLGMSKAPIPISGGWESGGFMSSRAGVQGKMAARKDIDPIAWMKGVKIGKRENEMQQSVTSIMSPSLKADKHWDTFDSLGEEITHVGDKFSNITFDEIDVQNRFVKLSMPGPWGPDENSTYVHCRMTFPSSYPNASTPTVKVEETASINLAKISEISSGIKVISDACLSYQKGSLEAILRYLHGDHSLEESVAWLRAKQVDSSLDLANDGAESSSDEEDDTPGDFAELRIGEMETSGSGLLGFSNVNANVPLPKACGAVWADDGRLVCFFPPKEEKSSSLLDSLSLQGSDEATNNYRRVFEGFGRPHTRSPLIKPRAPTLQTIEGGESESETGSEGFYSSSSSSTSSADFDLSQPHLYPPFTWRSSTLNTRGTKSAMGESQRSSGSISGTKSRPANPKNIVSIHKYESLLPAKQELAQQYILSGPDVCDHNARVARSLGHDDLADIWSFITIILADEVPLEMLSRKDSDLSILVVARRALTHLKRNDSAVDMSIDTRFERRNCAARGSIKWGQHPLGGQGFIKALFSHLERLADVQMLAIMSCVFSRFDMAMDEDKVHKPRHQSDNGGGLKGGSGSSGMKSPLRTSGGLLDYFASDQVAWSLLYNGNAKRSASGESEKLNIDPPSVASSLGASGSDSITPFSTGATPPSSYMFSRKSFDRSDSISQSISTSPEQYRSSHRSNSNLASAFGAPFSLPFAFSASASSSPPTFPKKKTSPAGSYVVASTPSVTWGATSIFGRSSSIAEGAKSTHVMARVLSDSVTKVKGVKTRRSAIKINLKNQDQFHDEGYAHVPLLDSQEEWRYQAYREAYANILSIWDMPIARAEVLKYNGRSASASLPSKTPQDSHASMISIGKKSVNDSVFLPHKGALDFRKSCIGCGKPLQTGRRTHSSKCTNCSSKQPPMTCIFCVEIIRGLSSPCLACGHVIHLKCRTYLLSLSPSLSSSPSSSNLNDPSYGGGGGAYVCISGCGCHCNEHVIGDVSLPDEPPLVEPSEQSLSIREGDDEEQQQQQQPSGWRNDDDAWEDVAAYESLAKNLRGKGVGRGGRGVRERASQLWKGAGAAGNKRGRLSRVGSLRREDSL